jgi:hypothetical protein
MISCHRCRRPPSPPIYFLSVTPIALHQKKREKEERESNRALVRRRFYDMKRKERENSIYVDKRGFDEI